MIYYSTLSFLLGIVFQKYFNSDWSFFLFLFLILLSVSLLLFKQRQEFPKNFFIIGIFLIFGLFRMSFFDSSLDQNLYQNLNKEFSFNAEIVEERDERDTSNRYIVKPIDSKSLVLLVADRSSKFDYGDKVEVSGKISLPKNFTGDNGMEFDYISYLSKDKIHFIIYQPKIILLEKGSTLTGKLFSIKNRLINNISRVVPEPNSSLIAGLLFGAKQSLGPELLNKFKDVGLIHIVVLSGYNITIIAAGILSASSYFGKRNLGFVISVVFIILFAVMVGLGATVVRAIIMSAIAILARFLGRPQDALRALFIAGLFMLLWNPEILFSDPSFQLSFLATFGLILFTPFVSNFISNTRLNKFIPEKFAIREIVSSTFAVQIFLLPILIKISGQVSIISFLVNPILLPLVPIAMFFGFITSVSGIFSSFVSWPFGFLSFIVTEIIIRVVEFASHLHFSIFGVGILPNYLVLLCYLGFAFLFHYLNRKPQPGGAASGENYQ